MQRDLPVDQPDVAADVARVAQQQPVGERGEPLGVGDRLDADAGAGEHEQVAAAERGGVLVLPAAGDPEVLAFDPVRGARELRRAEPALAEHRERRDHRGHERGGSPEPAAGRRFAADLDVEADVESPACAIAAFTRSSAPSYTGPSSRW